MRRALFVITRCRALSLGGVVAVSSCPHRRGLSAPLQPTTHNNVQQHRLFSTNDDEQQQQQHPIINLFSSVYSISASEVDDLIRATCPILLDVGVSEMEERLNNLHRFGITYSSMVHLIRNVHYNGILTLTVRRLNAQVNRILSHTMFTSSDIKRLVLNSPNVLTDDVRTTTEKVAYLQYDMGRVDENMVASSGVMRHSLRHMRERHIFLSRRGLYLQVDRHKLSEDFNPEITSVFNTTVERFCSRVANASVEEFETFQRLLRHEDDLNDRMVVDEDQEEGELDDDDPKNGFANNLLKYV